MASDNSLTLAEKKFLLYVERGDVASTRRVLLQTRTDVSMNTNCVDPLGRSALVIAIQNENADLINLLLNFGVEAKDALLHAIREEYVEAVEILLEHEEKVHQEGHLYNWECVDPDMATYDRDITPIIAAAHQNNFEIIKMLLDRGATLPVPHQVKCSCEECVSSSYLDGLGHSRSRINAFAALASPSLIALSSQDPILTAFELSAELRRLSFAETQFQSEYQTLRRQVEDFATALLDNTHSSQELSVILNHEHSSDRAVGQHGEREQLARLRMAAKYRQKKFVAHANVQQLLTSVWYQGMTGFRRKNALGQICEIFGIGIMLPLSWIVYTVAPSSSCGRKLQLPFVKFINHCTSYCFFLFLLVMVTQQVEQSIWEFFGPVARKSGSKGDLPTYVEMAILVYIIGFVVADMQTIWRVGIIKYYNDVWNVVDLAMNLLYITWMLLRAFAWYQVHKELKSGVKDPMIREEWSTLDPMLISEAVFSSANILSFLKVVHMFPVNHHLGPLQISLGRMIYDIIKFFFIYMLVLFAFGCGMNQLLWYYAETDKKKCYSLLDPSKMNPNEEMSCEIWRRFSNLFETSQSLFWASFGLVDIKNFELSGIKSYTRFWALLMFGFYSVINVVVLLNLLIAMMSNSYQTISARADIEWKFSRTKLWLKYFENGSTMPPPFNIIPTFKSLRKILGIHKHLICTSPEAVMRNLVLRFIKNEQRISEEQGITEDDVKEIKQDISTFRYDLIDIFRNNGIDCPSVHNEKPLVGGKKERNRLRRLMKGFNTRLPDWDFEPEHSQMKPSSKPTKDHQELSYVKSGVSSIEDSLQDDSVVIDFPTQQQHDSSFSRWI